jgi:glycosyltransferase involved in cell wall biosynthesis
VRVLMLAQFYAPIVGGEERMVEDLSVELARRGHHVAVATLAHGAPPEEAVERGVRVHRIASSARRARALFRDAERRHAPPVPDPEAVWALRRVLDLERPDVVHAHNWLLHSFLPLKRRARAKLVVTLHDYGLVCSNRRLVRDGTPCGGPGPVRCLRCAARTYGALRGPLIAGAHRAGAAAERAAVDLFLPVSRTVAVRSRLAERGLSHEVIPNFVPDDLGKRGLAASPRLDSLPPEFVLYAGDLSADKGVGVLLAAHAALPAAPPLVLVGRRSTPRLDLGRASVVLDPLPHDDLLAAWRRASVAVVPSITPETFGLVALEAMALGRPVVASRTGGLAELVVDGESGLLVPPGDADALRAALATVLANPALRARMGGRARERAAAFTASAVVPRVESAYRRLLGAREEVPW